MISAIEVEVYLFKFDTLMTCFVLFNYVYVIIKTIDFQRYVSKKFVSVQGL